MEFVHPEDQAVVFRQRSAQTATHGRQRDASRSRMMRARRQHRSRSRARRCCSTSTASRRTSCSRTTSPSAASCSRGWRSPIACSRSVRSPPASRTRSTTRSRTSRRTSRSSPSELPKLLYGDGRGAVLARRSSSRCSPTRKRAPRASARSCATCVRSRAPRTTRTGSVDVLHVLASSIKMTHNEIRHRARVVAELRRGATGPRRTPHGSVRCS